MKSQKSLGTTFHSQSALEAVHQAVCEESHGRDRELEDRGASSSTNHETQGRKGVLSGDLGKMAKRKKSKV